MQQAAASGLDLAFQKELSELRDLDYTRAISELAGRQTAIEAAQKAFVRVTGQSLFDLL
jgi:flagellar hook-associated protein 3 FlgL